jgi:hypothetical protein
MIAGRRISAVAICLVVATAFLCTLVAADEATDVNGLAEKSCDNSSVDQPKLGARRRRMKQAGAKKRDRRIKRNKNAKHAGNIVHTQGSLEQQTL